MDDQPDALRRTVLIAMLLAAGCSGEHRFRPESRAIVVRAGESGSGVGATAKGAGGTLTPDTIVLKVGTTVLIESDDEMSTEFTGANDTTARTHRDVKVLVMDGEFKGERAEIDYANLRAVPE